MTARTVVHVLLALQNCTDETQAQALIDRLADPWTRAVVRREWDHLHASQVQQIGDAS